MEEKKNNKNLLLIIIGLIVVAGISLFVGFSIGNSNKDSKSNEEKVESSSTNRVETQGQNNILDNSSALNVVENLYNKAMNFYTFEVIDNCTWKSDNNSCVKLETFWSENPNGGFIKITNYHAAMNEVFTKSGLEQFEKFMKEELTTQPFIKEEKGNMYVLAPTSGLYTGFSTRNLQITNITSNSIKATIDVVDAYAESEKDTNAIKTKNIIIKKENNKWLIEEFAIPMH